MALMFEQFEYLAEQNPAQYMEIVNALQQTYSRIELEQAFAENMAKYYYAEPISSPYAAGHTFINTGTRIAGEYLGPVSSSTETALELATEAYDYEVIGANGQVLYRANMGALKTVSETQPYQATSLLSLDVGVVGAALAPLLGVSLGIGLYESNPKFWTQLSQKLLPFCYPGTTKIPGWLDIVESALHPGTYESNVVLDKRILDALNEFFQSEKVNPDSYIGTYGNVSVPYCHYFMYILGPGNQNHWFQRSATGECKGIIFISSNIVTIYWYSSVQNAVVECGTIETGVERTYTMRTKIGTTSGGIDVYHNSFSFVGIPNNYGNPQIGSPIIPEDVISSITTQELIDALFDGVVTHNMPVGTDAWAGDEPDLNPYSKSIIYMQEDTAYPETYVPVEAPGISIAVPEKSTWPESEIQSTKPENWPESENWPMEIEFPWEKPDGYEGDWPETMTWPLPADKPDYWPDIIPYPRTFSYPAPTIDPEDNPDPNNNRDPVVPSGYIDSSQPGTKIDPSEEPEPQPQPDPSIPNPTITAVIPADPPGPPGVTDPPPDEGETPVPVTPIIGLPFTSANDGLITVYHPTDAQLKAFASWLWVTYADPSIEKLWNNPFDGVIGLMELYCTPTDVGMKNIRSGFLDSGIPSQTISRYTEIDCGSIYVPEYYGNYLDYSPYAKAHAYLPFIGIVELNVDDVVGHGINITYKIDEYNGACIAIVTCARHVEVNGDDVDYSAITYQFSGNCAVELPLAGGTQSAIRAGLIQAAAYGLSSVVGGIVSGVAGNIGGAISQIGYGAANAIGSVVSAKSSVQHSGSFGSSYGALGLKVPFIIVSRPKQLQVLNYQNIYGFPAHAGVTIGACRGYLRVREVHVLSSTATDEEKKRIEELLKEGVYV